MTYFESAIDQTGWHSSRARCMRPADQNRKETDIIDELGFYRRFALRPNGEAEEAEASCASRGLRIGYRASRVIRAIEFLPR